jgi:transcription termination/antitermination protein NusA
MVFVREALRPSEISSIRADDKNKTMEIMVEDTELSKAIGRRGQNVRLAAQITGWKLDIISKTKLQRRIQDAITNLVHIEGMNETLARSLAQNGILNIRMLAEAPLEFFNKVPGFEDKDVATRYKDAAQALVDSGADYVNGIVSTAAEVNGDASAKEQADQKLKEMIQLSEGKTETKTETESV